MGCAIMNAFLPKTAFMLVCTHRGGTAMARELPMIHECSLGPGPQPLRQQHAALFVSSTDTMK